MAVINGEWVNKVRSEKDHREFVGPTDEYDINAAMQFNLLTSLGLREHHKLLDIGCGSLRGARLSIMYLKPGNYYGIEPEKWLVQKAIQEEVGECIIDLKSPSFDYNSDFNCSVFDTEFDYILCQGVFTHAPECMIRKGVHEAANVMKSTTIFVASYFQGKENHVGEDWVYPKTFSYTEERIIDIAQKEGLKCIPLKCLHPRKAKWYVMCKPEIEMNVRELIISDEQKELDQLQNHTYVKLGLYLKSLIRRFHP